MKETFFTGPQNLLQSQCNLNNSNGIMLYRNTMEQNRKFRISFYLYENLRYD